MNNLIKMALDHVSELISSADTLSVYNNVRNAMVKAGCTDAQIKEVTRVLSESTTGYINAPLKDAQRWVNSINQCQ